MTLPQKVKTSKSFRGIITIPFSPPLKTFKLLILEFLATPPTILLICREIVIEAKQKKDDQNPNKGLYN